MKTALICGAGGFIGSHLVKELKQRGYWVQGVDLKLPMFGETAADEFIIGDLRDPTICHEAVDRRFDEVYQLAADMGGAGYVFTGENDADIMHNSATINLNILEIARRRNIKRIFYSSSACVYPAYNQENPDKPITREDSVYPAAPDSEYGWKSCFPSASILPTTEITAWNVGLLGITIFSGPKALGKAARKNHLQHCVAKSPRPRMVARSRSGGTVNRLALFFISTSVLRPRCC